MIIEPEVSVLSAVLIEPSCLGVLIDKLKPEHFGNHQNRIIYSTICSMASAGDDIDLVMVKNHLSEHGNLESAGGATYLASLLDSPAISIKRVDSWADAIIASWKVRKLGSVGSYIHALAGDATPEEADDIIDKAINSLVELNDPSGGTGFAEPFDDINRALSYIDSLASEQDGTNGYKSGFEDLDNITGPFRPGQLIIIGARPGMGKTSFVTGIADSVASRGATVAFFSLEMTRDELNTRRLSCEAEVDLDKVRKGYYPESAQTRIVKASTALSKHKVFIDDTGGLTSTDIRLKASMLRGTRRSLDFIIVDYLQIMGTERFNENRAVELGVITTRLKTLAKELGCPMIVLSQLSRETSKRQDPRPILTDLRDSGAIEQDADKVILLHRQEYYEPHNPEFQGSAEAIVAKNRQGACGVAKLAFLKEFTKFGNYQHRQ